ncbi:MAG: alpha/beta hydrolase [Owenweeksia sp.]
MPSFLYRSASFSYTDPGPGIAVIFLHGFLENQSMWKDLITGLPKKYRAITLDFPGHGDSENLGYIHTMEDMAEVIKALVNILKLKKVFLAGHSMGGYAALAFAEKYPDHIRGIILQNSTARADSAKKKTDRNRAIALVKENPKSFVRKSIPNLFRPKNRIALRETVNTIKKEALKTSPQGIVAALEGMKIRPDREVLLHFAPYPVLFIAARHDPILPFSVLEPQLQAERVTPCITENGHMSHIEDKEIVLASIRKFLNAN